MYIFEMNDQSINNPHDKLFKSAFSLKTVARSFIEEYLPCRIDYQIDLDNLQSMQNDSVDNYYSEYFSDLVYIAETIPARIPIILLFEHKSKPDPRIGIQLKGYIQVLEKNYSKMHPEAKSIVHVIPMVIYNGTNKWKIANSVRPLYEPLGGSEKYIPDFKYELFDISQMPDEQIKGTPLLRIVLLTMKYIKSKNLETKLDDILVIFKELSPDSEDAQFWQVLATYVDNAARPDKRRQCARKIIEWFESGDQDMSGIIDQLKFKYKMNGKIEDARKMHANGMSVEIIHEITGLSKRRIIQLKKEIEKNGEQNIPNVFDELETTNNN